MHVSASQSSSETFKACLALTSVHRVASSVTATTAAHDHHIDATKRSLHATAGDKVRVLAVDGADDEESAIVFSDPTSGKTALYELTKPQSPDPAEYGIEIHGLVEDVPVFDSLSGDVSTIWRFVRPGCRELDA